MRILVSSALAAWLVVAAPPQVTACVAEILSAGGVRELAPCIAHQPGGYFVLPRSALAGAESAWIAAGGGRYPVRLVSGENPFADLVEVWAEGAALVESDMFAGPPSAHKGEWEAAGGKLILKEIRDYPGVGELLVLEGQPGARHRHGEPVRASSGAVVGVLICHEINGAEVHFAAPASVLQQFHRSPLLKLAEWNEQQRFEPALLKLFEDAQGYFWAGDPEGARFYLAEYLRRRPADAAAWFLLAFAEGKSGNSRGKLLAFRNAVEYAPSWGEALYNLGIACVLAGDRQEAVALRDKLRGINQELAARLDLLLEEVHVDTLPDKPPKPPAPQGPTIG